MKSKFLRDFYRREKQTPSVMLYGSETWSVKEKDVIRLGYYNARMIR